MSYQRVLKDRQSNSFKDDVQKPTLMNNSELWVCKGKLASTVHADEMNFLWSRCGAMMMDRTRVVCRDTKKNGNRNITSN